MIGSTLSHFKITAKLGEGGMGEVYRATDSKLDREVAIKVLPEEFTKNPERLARFAREARVLASLNHPNIAGIHQVEAEGETHFLVMELVEGVTLAEIIDAGPILIEESLELARQIAEGLEAAHEKDIVHRDLKPANVKVTPDGQVKILDFGLAKASDPKIETATGPAISQSPTLTQQMTVQGAILGTASYMSPEQARGLEADRRADIWSFGVVLWELLSGKKLFARSTVADTLAAVLGTEPDWEGLPRDLPGSVIRLLRRCLSKDLRQRLQAIGDARLEISDVLAGDLENQFGANAPRARLPVGRIVMAVLTAAALGIAAGVMVRSDPPAQEPPQTRTITYSGSDTSVSASSDGTILALVSVRDGVPKIWLKRMPDGDEVALTEGPDSDPRISPDGSEVLFARNQGLYRIPILGGSPRKLVDDAGQADWSPDGERIVFVRGGLEGAELRTIGADGSGERFLYRAEGRALTAPRWSPDGAQIASSRFLSLANVAEPKLLLVDVTSGSARTLTARLGAGQPFGIAWSSGGEALIYAQPLNRSTVSGGWVLVRHDVTSDRAQPLAFLEATVSSLDILFDGVLLVGTEAMSGGLRERVLDESSGREGYWLTHGSSLDRQPAYSPDGERVIFSSNRSGNLDLWEISRVDGTVRRLTDHPAYDWDPGYSPDGRYIIWSSDRGGHFEIWIAEADGRNPRQVTDDGFDAENPTMTADGEWIVYNSAQPEKGGVWKIRPDGTDATHLAAGATGLPEVSPDGRHVVFSARVILGTTFVDVVRIEDGTKVPFRISCEGDTGAGFNVVMGRARWLPDGTGIAFICGEGGIGIYRQDFRPDTDTRATRRLLVSGDDARVPESFGISPDGKRITVAEVGLLRRIETVSNLPGVSR